MKAIVKILTSAACFIAVACSTELQKEITPTNNKNIEGINFTGTLEQQTVPNLQSKVLWNEDGDIKLEWAAGDEIAIFDGVNVVKSATATAGEEALFEKVIVEKADKYLAWYPYTETLTYDDNLINGIIPGVQLADSLKTPMFAETETNQFEFKNACAVIYFTLNVEGVTQITFSGNNGETVAGAITVDNTGASPVVASKDGEGLTSVTLKKSKDNNLTAGQTYYISVLPQTLEKGFKLYFEGNGFSFEKAGTKAATLIRSHRLNLGTITYSREISVANVDNNYFEVKGLDNYSFNTITFETLLNGSSFEGKDAGINSIFGVENKWLVRVGDSGYGANQLQIAAGSTNGGNWPSSSKAFSFDTNKWYHVAIVWDSATKARKIYINGKEYYSDEGASGSITFNDGNNKVFIGRSYNDNRPFHGCFAEMRVWDCVRTPEQIKENMLSLKEQSPTGLKAYWKFNEGSGNAVTDYSGNNCDVTSNSDLTWKTETPTLQNLQFQKVPYMYKNYFPVNLANSSSLDEITVEWKMNVNKWTNDANNLVTSVLGIEGKWLIRIGDVGIGDNQLQLATSDGNWSTGIYFDADKWYQVAFTYNKNTGTTKVYVDGILKAESQNAKSTVDLSKDCYISKSYDDSRYIQGCICDMRVWNVERTEAQIAANKYELTEKNPVGLMAYWKMDEGTGKVVKDYSGNGEDLTANNDIEWRQHTFIFE